MPKDCLSNTPSIQDLLSFWFQTGKMCWPQVSLIGRNNSKSGAEGVTVTF
jgi:hypothetical protein